MAKPSPPPTIIPDTIYSAAHFHAKSPSAAAYAVYFQNQSHQVRLAQPLQTTSQAYRTAALQGLLSALEIATCLHLKDVHVLLDDRHLVDLFLSRPSSQHSSAHHLDFTTPPNALNRRVSAPVRLHAALDLKIWRSILTLADNHIANGGALSVSHAPDAAPMPMVRKLAENAIRQHRFCSRCSSNYGPSGTPHSCGSIPPVIDQHTDPMGNTCVSSAVCPSCKRRFDQLSSLERHIESECPEVLQNWFSHTKIVKL